MIFGSVCSGIEGASVAWAPLGWKAAWCSEIEAFPSAVLAHRWPDVPNLGDMTRLLDDERAQPDIDVLVGGTPCQSFSVAGLRKGLDDPRGNLALVYLAIAERLRPRWLVWENVPGVLSSNGGRDFGAFLGALVELGYGFAYRVLDAQFFGVPQRRRRVFVVGYLGDWRRAAAVLFERHCLQGHPAPRRESGQDVAGTIGAGSGGGCKTGPDEAAQGLLISSTGDIAHCLNAGGMGRQDYETETLIAFNGRMDPVHGPVPGPLDTDPQTQCVAFSCKDHGADVGDTSPTLRAMGHDGSHANAGGQVAVAFAQNQRDEVRVMDQAWALAANPGMKQQTYVMAVRGRVEGGSVEIRDDGTANALLTPNGGRAGIGVGALMTPEMAVRRLTPRECSRLQGFPDDYLEIEYRGKPAADGPRYKALGNSMAVPVVRWIGERIAMVDAL